MSELTVIYFDYGLYQQYKDDVKSIIIKYGLKWQDLKMNLNVMNRSIVNAYKSFCIFDKIENDRNLIDRAGAVGLWSNEVDAIKIIIFNEKTKDEKLPVLLVFKGIEGTEFYHKLMRCCILAGCTLSKIIEIEGKYEEIFRKRLNIELRKRLENIQESKNVLENNFDSEVVKYNFDSTFISKWKECIQKYGNFTVESLKEEMENIS